MSSTTASTTRLGACLIGQFASIDCLVQAAIDACEGTFNEVITDLDDDGVDASLDAHFCDTADGSVGSSDQLIFCAPFDSSMRDRKSFWTRPCPRHRCVTGRIPPAARDCPFRDFFDFFDGALASSTIVGVDRTLKRCAASGMRVMSALTTWADSPYSRESSFMMPSITWHGAQPTW
jgi:hypothetical protein